MITNDATGVAYTGDGAPVAADNQFTGIANIFLPYGSTDASVLYRSPLTSSAVIATPEIGSVTASAEVGTGTTYDVAQGMKPGTAGGYYIDVTGNAVLDDNGQLSLEVERGLICIDDPANFSYGDTVAAQSDIMVCETNQQTLFRKDTGGVINSWFNNTTADEQFLDGVFSAGLQALAFIHTAGKDGPFVKVNSGWSAPQIGGMYYLAMNGFIVAAGVRNAAINDLFARLFIGSNRGLTNFMGNYFCRNLQISSAPPKIPTPVTFGKLALLSDSMLFNDTFATGWRDVTSSLSMRRELENVGVRFSDVYFSRNSGDRIFRTGFNDLFGPANMALFESENAEDFYIRGGSNDTQNTDGNIPRDITWLDDYKITLTTILGWPATKRIVLGTIPSLMGDPAQDTTQKRADRDQFNNYMKTLPAWDSRISIDDTFVSLGSDSPVPETFIGQATGGFDDIHFAALGHYLNGVSIANSYKVFIP